jgi:thioredoxin-like negative regulator of GroEL
MTRRIKWILKAITKTLVFTALMLLLARFVGVPLARWLHKVRLSPAERLVAEANELAEKSNWRDAAALYKRAEAMFHEQGNAAMELYARVSQLPAQT